MLVCRGCHSKVQSTMVERILRVPKYQSHLSEFKIKVSAMLVGPEDSPSLCDGCLLLSLEYQSLICILSFSFSDLVVLGPTTNDLILT